jgi:hypothetical protein
MSTERMSLIFLCQNLRAFPVHHRFDHF